MTKLLTSVNICVKGLDKKLQQKGTVAARLEGLQASQKASGTKIEYLGCRSLLEMRYKLNVRAG